MESVLSWYTRLRWLGLLGGPLLAALLLASLPSQYPGAAGKPVDFSLAGRMTLAVMGWMAVWWITEAVHLSVTSLLPLVLFPLLGIASIREATAPYANPMIFLFMGGFIIAISMQRWELDRRLALMTLRLAGTRPRNMIAGFMLTTAALSAFVSNTATTAMMVPIALSVIGLMRNDNAPETESDSRLRANLVVCLLLGIAYSASIGGMATIIGTPPNALLVAFLESGIAETHRIEIGFDTWLLIGLPVTLIMLPLTWLLLTRILFPVGSAPIRGGRELISSELRRLGRLNHGEIATLVVFVMTALCWIFRPLLSRLAIPVGVHTAHPLAGLSDAGIAMTGALVLFVIPVDWKKLEFVMDWPAANQLPWGILLLFGGGLSLAAAVKANGVAEFIGSQAHLVAGMPSWVVVVAVTTIVIFLTELTSNSATTATLLPVLAALAPALTLHPFQLIFPATLAASCAFMMPVATPPNAIVFGSGEIRISHMLRAGIWLNIIGIALISILTMQWFSPLLVRLVQTTG